jgi:multisubunit Na+/H+ antiporter MnhB subunit
VAGDNDVFLIHDNRNLEAEAFNGVRDGIHVIGVGLVVVLVGVNVLYREVYDFEFVFHCIPFEKIHKYTKGGA